MVMEESSENEMKPSSISDVKSEARKVPESQESVEDYDPNTMRRTKPGLKRLILTLTVLFSFIIGFPFLLKTIEIYRSPLPFRAIDSLSKHFESNPLVFPCRFQAVFIGFNQKSLDESHAEKVGFSILEEMKKLTGNDPNCGSCGKNYTVSVTIESGSACIRNKLAGSSCFWQCGAIDLIGDGGILKDDEAVDELLESVSRDGGVCSDFGGKVYTVIVMNREEKTRIVVGKHRHAWMIGRFTELDTVPRIADIFVKLFMNGGREEGLIHEEFMPVGSDGNIVLSFSLLNDDPRDWIYTWDFHTIEEILLAPVMKALAPVANITVESQVLYHTPKSSFSYWDEKLGSYIFNIYHLQRSALFFLQLSNGDISMTNGFISPMWGGVIVWNPHNCSRDQRSRHPSWHTLSTQDLEKVFAVFMGQLRQLFGFNSNNFYAAKSGISNLLASGRGFTEWELDFLLRHHTCFNLLSCVTTLGSLSRLVQSLPRMIIMDEIGKQVKFSLEAAKLAKNNASLGIYDASTDFSRQARSLAEDAFFHPSIMSVSYYSFEHCFAIYTPFFLPVSLHILLAAIKEWRRYKLERAKYISWKAKANAAS